MRNLIRFRDKAEGYYKQTVNTDGKRRTQRELAAEIGLDKDDLSKRLNEYEDPKTHRTWLLTDDDVLGIVRTLAMWGAIATREQALELLELMEYPRISSLDWATEPLSYLRRAYQQPSHLGQSSLTRNNLLFDRYIPPNEVFERVHLDDFVGRGWLEADLKAFLDDKKRDRGVWLLVGAAGVGKTSFLAYIIRKYSYIHCFAEQAPGDANVPRALQSLAVQLIQQFNLEQFVGPDGGFRFSPHSPDFLARLFHAASEKLGAGKKLIIVIDALDEAGTIPGGNVLGLPNSLPRGVYLILSQRPVRTALNLHIEPVPHLVQLQADEEKNQQDIRAYLHLVAAAPPITEQLAAGHYSVKRFVHILSQKVAGNWMYLHYLVEEVKHHQRTFSDLADLPDGLIGYYAGFWDRWRESPEWDRLYAPVLATLTATFESIPLHLLKEWAQVDMGLFELRRLLKEQWGAFMYEQDGVFRFYHASLRDFLAGQVDRKKFALPIEGLLDELRERGKKAHRHIASHLFPLTEGGKMQELVNDSHQYCLRYLPRHLHVLGSADDLYALLESASWRTAKIKFDPSYYALAQDVELSLNLSRSALEAAIAQHQPIQHVFSLLSPFCAHSLFLSILQETASNIPPQLLGVLAHLDQTETALGYAELLHSPDSYRYIAEALEATGRSSEATDVRRRMAATRTDAMGPSKRYPGSQQDESSLTAVRELLAQEDSHTALKRAKSIRSEEERNRALSSVALFVARKGDGEEAQGIAHGITDPRDRVVILALIAKASYERNNNNLAHSCMSNAIRLAESIPGGFEQAHAFIAIAKALASFTTLESNEITEKDLAIKLAHQATLLAEADSDLHDQAITLVSVAECFLDLKETGAARRVIEKAYNIATAMIRKDRTLFHEESDTRQFFFDPSSSWNYNAPLGVHVMEELPHLFASVGDIERAQEVMKQVIHAAKRIGSGHLGSRLIPEDIVRWLALQGPPYLVKKVAKEVLPTGELEASLWFAAGSLLEEGQFEDALAFIEDGRIAPGRPRYEIVETLTNAAMWLVKSKQFIRAQQISEMAIEYAQDVPTATSFIWLLSGIARGLKRPQLQEITHAVVHFALQAGWSIYRPHRWLLIHDCIDALLEASTADQATQLAQWIVKTAVTHKEEMEANEDNGIREMWVTMLRMAAKAYASAGNIDQAIATIDRFGDEYGKGRRYLYALGEVYVSLKKSELHERMEEFRQDVHVFANSMLAYAKELLSLDSDDAFANGMITDTLVTLARIDAVDRALEEAKKIQDSYYRALCLGTIVYEAAPNHRLGEYVDIAQQILAYAKEMRENGRSVLCARTIKALARIGRVDLAEQAIRKYWLADERFQMSIDAFGKVTRVDSASEPKYWDQNAFADILAEMILCGSQWSAYVIADLFIQGYFRVWEDLAAVAPAFSLMNAADDLWQRIRKLMIPSGELKISQDMCDEMGIIDIFSDVRTVH